jgi:anti-sigma factor RsiW
MTDHNRKYDLDDELLSAYIDNELSAEERAAVEARLASDPAAQQLLHELRSVSQSV